MRVGCGLFEDAVFPEKGAGGFGPAVVADLVEVQPIPGHVFGQEAVGAHQEGVEVYEINGPFFFGAAEKFKDTLAEVSRKPKVLIIRMRNVPAIDSTAIHALQDLIRRTRRDRG